jgi:hypothetical protein
MPGIIPCPSCQRQLRLPETLAGQLVQCPTCGHTFKANLPEEVNPLPSLELMQEPTPSSRNRPPEPISTGGPLQLSIDEESSPRRIPNVPPPPLPLRPIPLDHSSAPRRPSRTSRSEMRCPYCRQAIPREVKFCPYCGEQPEKYDTRDLPHSRRSYRVQLAHRGGLILAMGVFGILLAIPCGPLDLLLALPAWIMGQTDLRRMRTGVMDPGGRGLTTAGTTCAIIATIVAVLRSIPMILGH